MGRHSKYRLRFEIHVWQIRCSIRGVTDVDSRLDDAIVLIEAWLTCAIPASPRLVVVPRSSGRPIHRLETEIDAIGFSYRNSAEPHSFTDGRKRVDPPLQPMVYPERRLQQWQCGGTTMDRSHGPVGRPRTANPLTWFLPRGPVDVVKLARIMRKPTS